MWSSIIQSIVSAFQTLVGMWDKKADRLEEKRKEAQSEEKVKAAKEARTNEQRDKAEELLKNINDAESPEQRKKWLEDLRKRVSS